MLGKGGVLSEMVARVIAGHLSSCTQRGTWMTRTSRVWYRAGRYPQKTEGRIFPDTHTHKDPTRLAPSNLGGKEMAYFHVFSLSLFIFSFLSVSSSCVNGQWNGFFRTASRLLHSIFETLMCLWHIFCLSHVKTLFLFLLLCYRNSGAGVERQSAARKAKSDCLAASIPGWTISTRLASITQPDRFVSPASVFDGFSSSDKSRSTSANKIYWKMDLV